MFGMVFVPSVSQYQFSFLESQLLTQEITKNFQATVWVPVTISKPNYY
jgi:hypothetical protein